MTDRREFLRHAGALGVAPMLALAERVRQEDASRGKSVSPDQTARDERFWASVRGAYTLDQRVINLDNGWINPAPTAAVDALVREARALEALPAEELERIFFEVRTRSCAPLPHAARDRRAVDGRQCARP